MTNLNAIRIILTADLKAFPIAWKVLRYEYKGRPALSLKDLALAINSAYLSGF